jgi:hypothetical protein
MNGCEVCGSRETPEMHAVLGHTPPGLRARKQTRAEQKAARLGWEHYQENEARQLTLNQV